MATLSTSGNQNVLIEQNRSTIIVSKRTVRFAKNVYQTKNVSSFADGEVSIGGVPWWIVVMATLLGIIWMQFNWVGWVIFFAGGGGIGWNIVKPKYHGLLLTLNSSDKSLFVTSDTAGLKQAITTIYDLIESDSEATYQLNISNSTIEGSIIQGHNTGNISSRS